MTRTGALEAQLSMDAAMEGAEEWTARALTAIGNALRGWTITADYLRRGIGDPPNPNVIGAVFRTAKRQGLIRYTGEQVLSTRPETHGRYIRVWERL